MRGTDDSAAETLSAEIVVLGGGLAGLSMAVALADAGLAVICIDRDEPTSDTGADIRTTAVAAAGQRLFERIGVWPMLAADVGPIHEIRVADDHAPQFLHFGTGERPAGEENAPLGWIVDNADLRRALYARVAALSGLRHVAPVRAARIQAEPAGVRIALENGQSVRAALLIGSDGRASAARTWARIPVVRAAYGQSAIVCTIGHSRPHDGVALEHFLPGGPFAVLPMIGNRSSIVWSERDEHARHLMGLDDGAFLAEMRRRTGDWLGDLRLLSRRAVWPLAIQVASRLTAPRLALVGEAAHAIHPVAGQGLNLSLRDVAALTEVIISARRLGLDVGGADVLSDYERRRRFDIFRMAAACDGLVRLFSNDIPPLRLARRLGLSVVDHMPLVKRRLMAQAMGLAGTR